MQAGDVCGSYALLAPIGRGGMGEVWRARHVTLHRLVALKVIHPERWAGDSPAMVAELGRRFEREARALAQLRSPHTVQVFDFGTAPGGAFFYAMELLEGLSLQALVEAHGPVPPGRAIRIARQICDALAEAHAAGLVHRDIKPANVFLCRLGSVADFVKLLDFGLVKHTAASGADQSQLTAAGIGPGSPAFMAPELIQGQGAPDGRADLYALGCVLYWLLSGALVFERGSPLEMLVAHASTAPEPLSARAPQAIPAGLEAVVMRCLAKDPAQRPADALVLRDALGACALESPWDDAAAAGWWDVHQPQAATAAPAKSGIDTRLAMQDPIESDPLSGLRASTRSLLQRGFAESRIDLQTFEDRLAMVRAAPDRGALERVVADIAPASALDHTPVPIIEPPVRSLGMVPARQAAVSIFGSHAQRGAWRPARAIKAVGVFGTTVLDFRQAILEPGITEVVCVSVFGSVEIIVPPGLPVWMEGVPVFGSFDHVGEQMPVPAGKPALVVKGAAVFGSVEVRIKEVGATSRRRR